MIKVLEIQYWSNRKVNLWLPIASNMPHSEEPACPFGNLLSTEPNYIGRRVISPKHILFDYEEEKYIYALNLRCSTQSYQKRYHCLKPEYSLHTIWAIICNYRQSHCFLQAQVWSNKTTQTNAKSGVGISNHACDPSKTFSYLCWSLYVCYTREHKQLQWNSFAICSRTYDKLTLCYNICRQYMLTIYATIYTDNICYNICWQYMLTLCKDIVTTPVWPILCAVTKLLARSLHAHTDPCIALSWYGYLMTKRLNMTYEWVELWNFERRYWPGIHKWGVLRLTIFSIPRSKTIFHRKHYV